MWCRSCAANRIYGANGVVTRSGACVPVLFLIDDECDCVRLPPLLSGWGVKVQVERYTTILKKGFVNGVPLFKQWKVRRYFDAYLKEELLFQKRARDNGWELEMRGEVCNYSQT